MKGSVAGFNMSLQLCVVTFDACFNVSFVLEILFLLLLTTIVALSFIAAVLYTKEVTLFSKLDQS